MPFAPSMGPGDTWAIVVPASWEDRARHFIARLPVSQDPNPGVWGFRPTPEVKRFFKQWSLLYVIGIILVFIWSVISIFRE